MQSLIHNFTLLSGIINSDGKLWKDQRRFLHEGLRHFGMKFAGAGKEVMETRIMVRNLLTCFFFFFI